MRTQLRLFAFAAACLMVLTVRSSATTSYFVRVRPAGAALYSSLTFDVTHSDTVCRNRVTFTNFSSDGHLDNAVVFVPPDTLSLQGLVDSVPRPRHLGGRLQIVALIPNPAKGALRISYVVPPPGGVPAISVIDVTGRRWSVPILRAIGYGRFRGAELMGSPSPVERQSPASEPDLGTSASLEARTASISTARDS